MRRQYKARPPDDLHRQRQRNLKAQRYAERFWVKDPSYRPSSGPWGGYWVHPDPPEGHGHNSSYINWGCRCPFCRDAASEYMHYARRGLVHEKPPPAASVPFSAEERRRMLLDGWHISDLARHFGVTVGELRRQLEGVGVEFRGFGST
jgi:hypothetical protein